jgi:hypothetical protein
MSSRLAEFVDGALVIGCARCKDRRTLSMFELVQRYGGEHKMIRVINRLRCSVPRCGSPPSYVALKNHRMNTEIVLVGPGAY